MREIDIEDVLPTTRLKSTLKSGEMEIDELMKVENAIINTNRIPILIGDQIEGVVATFRDIESIQITEQKIRSNLHKRGMVSRHRFADIIGESDAIKKAIRIAKSYAKYTSNIMLIGEIGTGKEMFAHSIHRESQRRNHPLVTLNCANISSAALLAELQGYENGYGPFGNKGRKEGAFELAHGGTLFLDKVEAAPLEVQAVLLRILEDKEVRRMGGDHVIPVDVRIIASTNPAIFGEIENENFLEELYYMLGVLTLEIPPLRERAGDSLLLCNEWFHHFFGADYRKYEDKILTIEQHMEGYNWKGNVRQLSNFVERVGVLLTNGVAVEDILSTLPRLKPKETEPKETDVTLERWSREAIIKALSVNQLNVSRTARLLKCSRSTLYKKMEEFNIRITNMK